MIDRLFEMTSILRSFMGKDGFPGMDLVQGYRMLLDHFNWDRFRGSEVPDLLSLGLCFLEGPGNSGGIEVFFGLAQVEALGDNLTRRLAKKLSAYEASRAGAGY